MADNPLSKDSVTEEELRTYIQAKESELDIDYQNRLNGIRNGTGTGWKIAGYKNLRDFFDGDHWSYLKEDGTPTKTYNYCRTTIINYTSFLSNEVPEDDMPPRDTMDDIEIARSEEVERLLEEIKRDNKWQLVFAEAVQNQSLLGDCFIFGPFIEWIKTGNKDKNDKDIKRPRIRFKNIKRVENVRALWSDSDYTEMEGFILYNRISVTKAERIYKDQMIKRGFDSLKPNVSSGRQVNDKGDEDQLLMTTLRIYFDGKYMLTTSDEKILDFVKHDWGFIPGIWVKNMSHPTRAWGVSDIEDILDAQVEYNEAASSMKGKIDQVSIPHVFYAGEGEPIQYDAGQAQMIKLGLEDRIFPDPMGQSVAPFESYADNRKADIHQLSMISEVFYGSVTSRATGRALSVLMQGVSNRVKQKQNFWRESLQEMNANILKLVEIYFPRAKDLIQGYYKTDIFFPSILIRDVTDEVNKFNMKLQSQYTTMKNLGIPSPKDEQKLMKKEWDDSSLMIEISRNPQLRMELQQILQGQIANALQQMPSGKPMLKNEDGGAGEEAEKKQPSSARNLPQQAPTSAEGSVKQRAFRGR